jgi:hypothetical protein
MNKTHEQMFGCDPDAMMAELLAPIAENGLARVLTSLLSDAQELLGMGKADAARQAINRVKYIVDTKLPRVRATPVDVAVQDEVGELRKLHAETTPGVWHALPGRALAFSGTLSNTGYSGFDVLRGMGRKAPEGKRNVQFCARMHNAAPALFDAAELVQHVLNEQEKLPRDQRDVYIVDRAQATLSALKQSQS